MDSPEKSDGETLTTCRRVSCTWSEGSKSESNVLLAGCHGAVSFWSNRVMHAMWAWLESQLPMFGCLEQTGSGLTLSFCPRLLVPVPTSVCPI